MKKVDDFLVLPISNFIKLFALVAFKLYPLRVWIIYIPHRVVSFERLIAP